MLNGSIQEMLNELTILDVVGEMCNGSIQKMLNELNGSIQVNCVKLRLGQLWAIGHC